MSEADPGGIAVAEEDWSRPRRWSTLEAGVVAGTAVLGFLLRFHDYKLAPLLSDNQDELAWAWSGLTLITRHVPYAWSYLPSYTSVSTLNANGTSYPIVHPWLDHPPLFSLVVGGYAWLVGARDLTDVSPEMVRPVAIVLSTLSLVLLYLLARRVLGQAPATIAMILLATAPVAVLFGRVVESEALLAPLILLGLLLVHRILTGEGGRADVVGLVIICIAAPVTKVPGIAIPVAIAAILASRARWRVAMLAAAGGAAGLLLYVGYGALMDWQQFVAVLHDQESRRHGVMAAYEFIASPAGIGRSIRDGWWLLGWIGIGAFLVDRSVGPRRLLVWMALIFSAAILLLADERVVPRFGWYRIPVYPLAYCGAAYLAWLALSRLHVGAVIAVLVLGGATAGALALGSGGGTWKPSAMIPAALLAVAVVPAVVAVAMPRETTVRRIAQVAVGGVLLLVVVLNVVASMQVANNYLVL